MNTSQLFRAIRPFSLFTLLFIGFGIQSTFAQTDDAVLRTAGTKELGFLYLTPGNSSDYPGGFTFNYTTYTSPKTAIRYGMSFSYGNTSSASDNIVYDSTGTVEWYRLNSDTDQKTLSIALHPQYMIAITQVASLQTWLGIGPYLSFYQSAQSDEVCYEGQNMLYQPDFVDRTTTRWYAGVYSTLSVDWFLQDNIALSASYGIKASYMWENYKYSEDDYNSYDSTSGYYDYSSEENTESDFSIATSTVALGLRFYF